MAISKAFIQKTLKKNFPKFGDAVVSCIYKSYPNQTVEDYDPDDGTFTDEPNLFTIDVIFADFRFTSTRAGVMEIENENVLQRDKKAIIQFVDFPTGTRPQIDDTLTDSNENIEYFVIGKNVDPYEAAHVLHLRPKDDL